MIGSLKSFTDQSLTHARADRGSRLSFDRPYSRIFRIIAESFGSAERRAEGHPCLSGSIQLARLFKGINPGSYPVSINRQEV
jgi:hypothetical protein